MRNLTLCLGLALAAPGAFAQTDLDVDVQEDLEFLPNLIVPRPIQKGKAVLSLGIDQRQYLHDATVPGGQNQKTQIPVLLRASFAHGLEARIDGTLLQRQIPIAPNLDNNRNWGLGDMGAGVKWNFLPGKALEMSFTPSVVFPTGARWVTDGGVEGKFDLSAMVHRGDFNFLLDLCPQIMHDNGSKDVYWQPNYAAGVFYNPGGPHDFGFVYSGYTPSAHPGGMHIDRLHWMYNYAFAKYTTWWVSFYMGVGPNDVMRALNTGVSFPIF
jgi:hypothetical protein